MGYLYLLFLLNNYEQLCSRGVYLILKADGRELAKVRSQICTALSNSQLFLSQLVSYGAFSMYLVRHHRASTGNET